MTTLGKQTGRVRRAAVVGLLVAVPLLPVAGCGDGDDGDNGNGNEVDMGDTGGEGEDDGGLY